MCRLRRLRRVGLIWRWDDLNWAEEIISKGFGEKGYMSKIKSKAKVGFNILSILLIYACFL